MASSSVKGGGGARRLHLLVLAALAQLTLSGCYNFTRVDLGAVTPGSQVRVRVSPGTQLKVGEAPLREDGGTVSGTVVRAPTADTLFCDVLLGIPVEGAVSRGLRGTVSIPAGAVQRVEVRTLDKKRTGGLVVLGLGLAWVLVDNAFDIHNGKEGTDNPGNVNNARITLFRLRW